MKVSIITVVYNRVATIERAIKSVLGQKYPHVEYIVIDGASTDGTVAVIEQYRSEIATFVTEKDKGMYDALNKGIQMATGDVIGILHADDVFADETILQQVADVMQGQPHIDCVYGDVGFVKNERPDKIVRYYSSANFKPELFTSGFMPAHPTFFCYKRYFELYGYYRTDLDIAADFDLLVRFFKKHQLKFQYIPEMLVRMNLGGKSTNGIRSTLKINKELKQILSEQNLPSSYLRLYSRYLIKVKEYWKNKQL